MENEQINPASIKELKSQIDTFKLQKYSLEAALNMMRYDQKNILDVLALKIADGEKKITTIDLNIQAVQLSIIEAEGTTTETPDKVAE